jgi:uncharacterized protein (DUF2249 family)/Fe-S cluster biogenesis protein NfuA/hemerythrin-like domain-containing protein
MATTHTLDVRGLSHEQKQGKLFPLLERLQDRERLDVTFEFDPLPLVYMLGARPELKVSKEQKGPQEWVLRIDKTGTGPATPEPAGGPTTKEMLKALLRELKVDHVSDQTKARAKELLSTVDAKTLGLLEQELIQEGVSHEEIRQSLCDVHLEAMRDTLVAQRIEVSAPHPIYTLMEEHKLIVEGLHKLKDIVGQLRQRGSYAEMGADLQTLQEVSHLLVEAELHHQREEDALFPRLYEHGITEPPDIMKEEHVEFRARKRALFALVNSAAATPFAEFQKAVIDHGEFICRELESHIFKEDNILYQIALQVLTEDEWQQVKRECDKIGYCCFKPQDRAAVVDLDLRPLPPPRRHQQIFEKWSALPAGGVLRITNDHDPKPLSYQFEAEHPGQFTWEYEQKGPSDWIVRIGRTTGAPASPGQGSVAGGPRPEASSLRHRVEQALESIRPALQADGGDVELLDVSEDGIVQVELIGACGGCPMSQMTLKGGIERRLKELVPEVTRVFA